MQLPANVDHLECVRCGWASGDFGAWRCACCGADARMDVVYRPEAIRRLADDLRRADGPPRDQWRYRAVLPLPDDARLPPLRVGGTPVEDAPRLAEWAGVARLLVKDDGLEPSGSTKDRASAVGVALALAVGAGRICCASTGNAASSTACLAASVGLPATIFVPRRAPLAKVAQLRVFGAEVLRVDAAYDATWELASAVAARTGWFDRNCAQNPYLVEGKKTAGLELAEQARAAWGRAPDWVAVSVGDGCSAAGLERGLREAAEAGVIDDVPRVLAVQAAGAAPLVRAAREGRPPVQERADTLADSIAVAHPRNPDKALRAVRRSAGAWIAVDDEEIREALVQLPRRSGVFGEPAAAAALAGLRRAVAEGVVPAGARAALLVTGNGLKDPAPALEAAGPPREVPADLGAVLRLLGVGR